MKRIFIFRQTEFLVNDQLDRHGSTNGFFGGRRDGLIIRVGMQRIAVVVDRHQRLQRGADVVKIDFHGMQTAAGGLDVVFQFLGSIVSLVLIF